MSRRPMSCRRSIPVPAAVGCHLPAHRRRSPLQANSDTSQRLARRQPPRDLLPFGQRQPKRRPVRTRQRSTEPRSQQMSPDRRRRPTQPAADRPLRLTPPRTDPKSQTSPTPTACASSTSSTNIRHSSKVMQPSPEFTAVMGGSFYRPLSSNKDDVAQNEDGGLDGGLLDGRRSARRC